MAWVTHNVFAARQRRSSSCQSIAAPKHKGSCAGSQSPGYEYCDAEDARVGTGGRASGEIGELARGQGDRDVLDHARKLGVGDEQTAGKAKTEYEEQGRGVRCLPFESFPDDEPGDRERQRARQHDKR